MELFTPFLNCGWKHPVDGCCSHPDNNTPECHQFCCPITVAQQSGDDDYCYNPILELNGVTSTTCILCGKPPKRWS